MMGRLVVDDLVHWATTFKVDGFRFDCMGHLMLETVMEARDRLNQLTEYADGINGKSILMYGEGWDFGEVVGNARGVNAVQANLSNSTVGSFNDRLRDGALGTVAFGDVRAPGFLTGLGADLPRAEAPAGAPPLELGSEKEQKLRALELGLWTRLGIAGNLAGFEVRMPNGASRRGDEVPYHSQTCAVASAPCETINYVACHDNMTLFDLTVLKLGGAAAGGARLPLDQIIRVNMLITSLIATSQGIPFFHAGDELLRSKSFDRDSYNSGDYFNALDFTGDRNKFGVGLPSSFKNVHNWPIMRPLLARAGELRPGPAEVAAATAHFETMLRIRASSPLFRLRSATDVRKRLAFVDDGATPGIVAFELDGGEDGVELDRAFRRIVVCFNATAMPHTQAWVWPPDVALALHPLQQAAADDVVKLARAAPGVGLTVPPFSCAVFVEARL